MSNMRRSARQFRAEPDVA